MVPKPPCTAACAAGFDEKALNFSTPLLLKLKKLLELAKALADSVIVEINGELETLFMPPAPPMGVFMRISGLCTKPAAATATGSPGAKVPSSHVWIVVATTLSWS